MSTCTPVAIEASSRVRYRDSLIRKRADGRTEILVADLVAAGRLDPLASDAPLVEIVTKSKTERELLESQRRVAVLEAEFDHQREQLNHLHEEVKFLRSLLRGEKAA